MKFVVEIPAEQEQAFKQAVEDCKGTCLIGSEDLVYEAIPVARIRRVLESCRKQADPILQKYYTTEDLLPEAKDWMQHQLSDYYLAESIQASLEEPLNLAKRLEAFRKKSGATPSLLKRAKPLILQRDMEMTDEEYAELAFHETASVLTSTNIYKPDTRQCSYYLCSLTRYAKDLSSAIQDLDDALFILDSVRDADEYRGTYLQTMDITAKPTTPKQEEAAKQLGKAIASFSQKMNTIRENITATIETEAEQTQFDAKTALRYRFIEDRGTADRLVIACALSCLDATKELRSVLPASSRIRTDRIRTDLEGKDIYLDASDRKIYEKGTQQLDYLRGRTKSTNKESFAEKTMRKVYSEHKDTVDYDKLNKETVERLLEKGASDKSIREIAEIAKKLNPTIKDTKKYTKYLLIQANNYRSNVTEK